MQLKKGPNEGVKFENMENGKSFLYPLSVSGFHYGLRKKYGVSKIPRKEQPQTTGLPRLIDTVLVWV